MSRETTKIIPPLAPIAETELVDAILHDVVAIAAPTEEEVEADEAHPTEDVDPPSKSSPPLLPPFPSSSSSSSPPPNAPRDDDADDDAIRDHPAPRDEIDSSSPRNTNDLPLDERLAPPPNSDPGRRTRKHRTEFTAAEKLKILAELDDVDDDVDPDGHRGHRGRRPTIRSITRKYNVSKSSLFRWKQPEMRNRLRDMTEKERKGDKKRDVRDPLVSLKEELTRFCDRNAALPVEERLMITTALIRAKGLSIKEELLEGWEKKKVRLEEEEVAALRAFKATKSWAGKMGKENGWLGGGGARRSNRNVESEKGDATEKKEEVTSSASIECHDAPSECDDAPSEPQIIAERTRQNTLQYLASSSSFLPPPKKKPRREFTHREKLAILDELSRPECRALTVDQICQKYDTSKSSLFRWKALYRNRGPQDGAPVMTGREEGKRLRRDDRFAEIKARLRRFVSEEREDAATETGRTVWHATIMQERARRYRDEMLERHDRGEARLDDETVKALRGFKASKAWIRKVVREWNEEGNGDDGNENGNWNVGEDDVGAAVEVEVEMNVAGNSGFDGVESGESPGDGVFDDGHVHEIDVETIIDGVTPHTPYHHHYQHGHDDPHYDQSHSQYDQNHRDQNHPHIAVMKEDEPHAHPYPDGVMRDYAKEMAEEAVDATMKLIGDMGNIVNVNGGKVGAWFPSREDHDDIS